jgi:hypothetical protein
MYMMIKNVRCLNMPKEVVVEKQEHSRGRGNKLDTSGKKQGEPVKSTDKKST